MMQFPTLEACSLLRHAEEVGSNVGGPFFTVSNGKSFQGVLGSKNALSQLPSGGSIGWLVAAAFVASVFGASVAAAAGVGSPRPLRC